MLGRGGIGRQRLASREGIFTAANFLDPEHFAKQLGGSRALIHLSDASEEKLLGKLPRD